MRLLQRTRPEIVSAAAAVLLWVMPAQAQETARVRVAENLRGAPNGERIARLDPGTPIRVVRTEGDWVEGRIEGWVWIRSLQKIDRGGLDLVVSVEEGENLRAAPSGSVLGHLEGGTLLKELERRPGWARVQRDAWIWRASLDFDAGGAASDPSPVAPQRTPTTVPGSSPSARPAPLPDGGGAAAVPPPASAGSVSSPRAAVILTAPDGDTLARTTTGSELEVVARQGNWARVRVEGWTWLPQTGEGDPSPTSLTPEQLIAEPSAHVGRLVQWRIRFISLERADRIRTDFYEGEPFLLVRFGDSNGAFVYVTVPPERLADVEGLVPLEDLEITGRVRTGASTLTRTPVVDLIAVRRIRPTR